LKEGKRRLKGQKTPGRKVEKGGKFAFHFMTEGKSLHVRLQGGNGVKPVLTQPVKHPPEILSAL